MRFVTQHGYLPGSNRFGFGQKFREDVLAWGCVQSHHRFMYYIHVYRTMPFHCNQGKPASRNHGDSVTLKLSFTAKLTTSLLFITLCCQLYLSHTQPHTHYGYTIFIVIFRCFINVTEATVESNSKSLMLIHILKMYLQL